MQAVYFQATPNSGDLEEIHTQMSAEMRDLAKQTGGFIEWRDCTDGSTYWALILFDSEEAVLEWRNHPRHAEIHRRGEEDVYSSFSTKVFELVRESDWSKK